MKPQKISKGKIRDIYDIGDNKLVIVTSDRISAFDHVLKDKEVPDKGRILNKMSAFWFERTKEICPNHMISVENMDMPEYFQTAEFQGRCMMVKKLTMLTVECIVRGYITGSGWKSYQENGSVCGIALPEGLQESEKLPEALYTPTTKAALGEHDEHICFQDTVQLLGKDIAEQLREKSIALYKAGASYAEKKGILIADSKFEFGIDEKNNVVLADELLTPDSSRFWDAASYEVGRSQKSFDKQYLRDYLTKSGWDKKTPNPFVPGHVLYITSEKYSKIYKVLTED